MKKFVSKEIFKNEIRPMLREEKKTVVLCHGVFDLVHPGHIVHLEQAKQMGDILVVSITAAKYVRKGPGRPYFDDAMRMKVLGALEYVDYVMLSEGFTADDIICSVQPDIYVKGSEYATAANDITGKISDEQELVERYGGTIRFTGGQVFSSTKLINTAMSGLPEDVKNYMKAFVNRFSMDDLREYADKISELKVLVIGDVIIDKYTYCNVQGLMSKDMGYSTQLSSQEEYLGGAAVVARHLSSFTDHVTLASIIGNEEEIKDRLAEDLSGKIQLELVNSAEIPTIVKHKYLIKSGKREEYRKVFAIHNIPEKKKYECEAKLLFKNKISSLLEQADVVFLFDFGHGLVDEEILELVQQKAKYLVLNCQTNSANHGTNIITKYTRADAFALDQRELKLAFPMNAGDEETALKKLCGHLGSQGWLTRGSEGAFGIDAKESLHSCPAFTLSVKDTVGAGDAFLAVAGAFTAAGAPTEVGTVMGNIAGALGANILGNKEAVEKVNVLKFASTLMNV